MTLISASGEYWMRDVVKLEQAVIADGGVPPPADAFTINGHPGSNYNCSKNGTHMNTIQEMHVFY